MVESFKVEEADFCWTYIVNFPLTLVKSSKDNEGSVTGYFYVV